MAWEKLAVLGDVPSGAVIEAQRGDNVYAICNVAGEVRALSGVCPHEGGPLGEGLLDGKLLTCPWHSWEFDCTTGVCTFDDSVTVPVYPVRVEENAVLVDIPA